MAVGFGRLAYLLRGAPIKGLIALALFSSFLLTLSQGAIAFPSESDFNAEVESPGFGPVKVADLDADGWNDILVIDEHGNVTVHFQDYLDQDFPFGDMVSIDSSMAEGMAVGALDMDDRMDVASFAHDSLVLNFQHSPRDFTKSVIPLSFSPNSMEIGDLNGDMLNDIVLVGDSELLVLFHNSSLQDFYGLSSAFQKSTGGDDVVLGDFGGSEGLDIALSSPDELNIFIQQPQGLDHNQTISLNGSFTSSSIAMGHFSSDLLNDIVVLRSNNGDDERIDIYAQTVGENFSFLQAFENDDFGDALAVGDLNDDGMSDIAVVADDDDTNVLLYIQQDRTRSEFVLVSLGNFSALGSKIALGELNGDSYTDIVIRTQDNLYLFYQDDLPPFSANYMPPRTYFNENTFGDNLIKLDDYIKDDHTKLSYAVIYESDPDLLHAVVDGDYLDFYAKKDWVGSAKFQVAGWEGDYIIHSNKFIVVVNDVPDILSVPITRGEVGEEYLYEVLVEDSFPHGDRVQFELAWGPGGMAIDAHSGKMNWTPEKNGEYKVAIIVRDRYGGKAVQTFVIRVGEDEEFPTAIVAAGAGVLVFLLSCIALAAWSENVKLAFLLLIIPLYTKLKREKILDHFVRGKIYGYILANPGEHYNAIREALDLTNGSLAHHLRTLEREGFIKSKRFGIYRRFYPMNMKMPKEEFEIKEIQKTILGVIEKNPGISQKEIASNINLTPPTVNYHIGILSHEGLVHVSRNGRKTECYLEV